MESKGGVKSMTLKIVIPVLIGIAVVVALFYKEFNVEALSEIKFDGWAWLCIGLAVLAVGLRDFGMAWRFHTLTDSFLRWRTSVKVTFLCEFLSAITPSSVGGSALSMFFLKKEGLNMGRATALTFTTLFLDELFFVVIVPAVFFILPKNMLFGFDHSGGGGIKIAFWIAYGLIALWTVILFLALIAYPHQVKKAIVKVFQFRLFRKWSKQAEELAENMYQTSLDIRHRNFAWWSRAFIATSVSWTGRYLVVNALFWGFFPEAPQLLVFCRQVVVWALLMFSPTPGGSGLSEWLFKEYYGDLISGAGALMVLALIWRFLSYYIYLIIGIFLLPSFFKKKTK